MEFICKILFSLKILQVWNFRNDTIYRVLSDRFLQIDLKRAEKRKKHDDGDIEFSPPVSVGFDILYSRGPFSELKHRNLLKSTEK